MKKTNSIVKGILDRYISDSGPKMVYNVKAGLAATASLATTATMAYNRYNEKDCRTKTNGNDQKMVSNNEGSGKYKTDKKSHDETVKQMQMWKF